MRANVIQEDPTFVQATSSKSGFMGVSACETRRNALDSRVIGRANRSDLAPGLEAIATRLSSDEQTRLAALLTFCEPLPQDCSRLQTLSLREWLKLLRWLDVSGLALCFYDRISEAGRMELLPTPIAAGLELRLEENTLRTQSMLAESIAIQRDFQNAGLSYAILKGLSFWPNSVSRPELRSQFDLDYLVAENDVPEARRILASRGYRLYASNGRSWEFKRNEKPGVTLKDLYKDTGSFRVELHTQPTGAGLVSPLETLEWRDFSGFAMPVLSPVDLLLGQGMHAFKHICSEYVRASHLLEFRRNVLFLRNEQAFWAELRERAHRYPRAAMGLGNVTFLITQVMGEFAPESLTSWTADQLPAPVKLWVTTYGDRAVLGNVSGSKLYLLLNRELDQPVRSTRRPIWRSLFPPCLPPSVIRAFPNDSLSVRLGRYRMQIGLICSRARFHFIEGLRLAHEAYRWRRLLHHGAR